MYDYLTDFDYGKKVQFLDGDIEEWDYRMVLAFQKRAYEFIHTLTKDRLDISYKEFKFMHDHETKSDLQVGDFRFRCICNMASGCFWTTFINCFVNEGYVRYLFSLDFPNLNFEDNVRMKALGDDHLIAISDRVRWTPKGIAERFRKELGQKYTSSIKGAVLEDKAKPYKDTTFLGAHPVKIDGLWCGAMKKDTIYQALQWTKKGYETDQTTMISMMEYASVWGKDFYKKLLSEVNEALADEGMPLIEERNPDSLKTIVANRVDDDHFYGFIAEGDEYDRMVSEGPGEPGIVTATATALETSKPLGISFGALAERAVNAAPSEMGYGLESEMYRGDIVWKTSDLQGDTISNLILPQDVLGLGNPDNAQNMAFQRFIYMTSDLDLIFEITGQPSLQGKLIIYELPLGANQNGSLTGDYLPLGCVMQLNHVCLFPNRSSTHVLSMKFKSFRSAMNTFTFGQRFTDYMGSMQARVLSRLVNGPNDVEAQTTVTMRSRFGNARFTIPRPLPEEGSGRVDVVSGRKFEKFRTVMMRPRVNVRTINEELQNERMVSEGAQVSTVTNNNSVTISDVAGNVPYQGGFSPKNKNEQSLAQDLEMPVPMHNPPLSGSSVPMFAQVPSMAKSHGLAPVHSMQLHPQEMFREAMMQMAPEELNIEKLMSRKFAWDFHNWTTSQLPGTVITSRPLNSLLNDKFPGTYTNNLNFQLALLNSFTFWRSDIRVTVEAVRTRFHGGKLMFTVAYGSPQTNALDRNVYISRVMDFSEENYENVVDIPWTAGTEFLRTKDFLGNGNVNHPIQDYSLGSIQVTVLNQLQANDTVNDTVEVILYFEFLNTRLAVPKALTFRSYNILPHSSSEIETEDEKMVSEGPGDAITIQGEGTEDVEAVAIPVTAEEVHVQPERQSALTIGRKFEHCPGNLVELLRRHYDVTHMGSNIFQLMAITMDTKAMQGRTLVSSFNVTQVPRNLYVVGFMVRPRHPLVQAFSAWSGHMKYRIVVKSRSGRAFGIPKVQFAQTPPYSSRQYTGVDLGSYWAKSNELFPGGPSPAVEYMGDVGGSKIMDVQVPFATHYNMLPVVRDDGRSCDPISGIPGAVGFITVALDMVEGDTDVGVDYNIDVYEAVGDDFGLAHHVSGIFGMQEMGSTDSSIVNGLYLSAV